jgi:carbon monoxide dehydrogenase subunit G
LKFEGSKEVSTGTGNVWKFITTPENMAQCMPDVQSYNVVDDNTVNAKLKVGIGFIKEIFDSVISFSVVEEGKKLLITVNSKGKSNTATIKIDASLEGNEQSTTLKWDVDAMMAGKLASIGQRYIQKVSDKIIEQAFVCMTKKLSTK